MSGRGDNFSTEVRLYRMALSRLKAKGDSGVSEANCDQIEDTLKSAEQMHANAPFPDLESFNRTLEKKFGLAFGPSGKKLFEIVRSERNLILEQLKQQKSRQQHQLLTQQGSGPPQSMNPYQSGQPPYVPQPPSLHPIGGGPQYPPGQSGYQHGQSRLGIQQPRPIQPSQPHPFNGAPPSIPVGQPPFPPLPPRGGNMGPSFPAFHPLNTSNSPPQLPGNKAPPSSLPPAPSNNPAPANPPQPRPVPPNQPKGPAPHPLADPTPTPADEILAMTEKPNLHAEGMLVNDKKVTAPLLDVEILSAEEKQSRNILRSAVEEKGVLGSASASSGGVGPSWGYFNVLDNQMMQATLENCAANGGLKTMSAKAQELLSESLQRHAENILKLASVKANRVRNNLSSVENWRIIGHPMYVTGDGSVTEAILSQVAMKWGAGVADALRNDEELATQLNYEVLQREEQALIALMKADEEARMKAAGAKKKSGAQAGGAVDISEHSWWQCDEQAEKRGLFNWEQLAESSFRADVAVKHQLGGPANKKKRKDDAIDPIAAYRPAPALRAESHMSTELDALTQCRQQTFPLARDQKQNIITYGDMLTVVRQPGFAALNMSAATSTDPIAKHFARWKFGGR